MADAKMFDVEELESMKRAQLQKLCKKLGIKANSKTSELIASLKEHAKIHFTEAESESPQIQTKVEECVCPFESETTRKSPRLSIEVNVAETKETCSEECSFKEQVMKQLEKKVQETLKFSKYESKIPRFAQFTKDPNSTSKTPKNGKDWGSVHNQLFDKMDSIDVYLEKKRKRTQSFYQNVKKAKMTVSEAKSVVAEMKTSHCTPAKVLSTRKCLGKSSVTGGKIVGFTFHKSPKVLKPPARDTTFVKQKTPASRKSVAFVTSRKEENKVKTPGMTRKSVAGTPFRFSVGNVSNIQASETKVKQKFDLKASLAKPLGYTPHTGKLKTPPFTKKDQTTSVGKREPISKLKKAVNHRVDIKTVKVTTRADRRKADMKTKAGKRKDAVARRRGLAC